jgi:hypothetical protein
MGTLIAAYLALIKTMTDTLTYKQAKAHCLQETPKLVSGGNTLQEIASMYADRVWDELFTNASDALLDCLQERYPMYT